MSNEFTETHRETLMWCETCRDVHGPSGPHVGETVSPDKAELLREIDRQHRRESIEDDAMTDEDRGDAMSDWRETHRETLEKMLVSEDEAAAIDAALTYIKTLEAKNERLLRVLMVPAVFVLVLLTWVVLL